MAGEAARLRFGAPRRTCEQESQLLRACCMAAGVRSALQPPSRAGLAWEFLARRPAALTSLHPPSALPPYSVDALQLHVLPLHPPGAGRGQGWAGWRAGTLLPRLLSLPTNEQPPPHARPLACALQDLRPAAGGAAGIAWNCWRSLSCLGGGTAAPAAAVCTAEAVAQALQAQAAAE